MTLGQDEKRGRIERERVVRLATIGGPGRAHVARRRAPALGRA